ncbi:unnamed protein product [Discosporangium mesarthrocarpum]
MVLYHEQQKLMHCAVHTLNNLFQESWVDRSLMEDISHKLFKRETDLRKASDLRRRWVNPYKSCFGPIGYYDINVVVEALKLKSCRVGLHVVYNPKRPDAFSEELAEFDLRAAVGVIVNRGRVMLGGLWATNHFYAIIPHGQISTDGGEIQPEEEYERGRKNPVPAWFNLDSKAAVPERLGDASDLIAHLATVAKEFRGQAFVVVRDDERGEGMETEMLFGGSAVVTKESRDTADKSITTNVSELACTGATTVGDIRSQNRAEGRNNLGYVSCRRPGSVEVEVAPF